jgi:hypothetical protein
VRSPLSVLIVRISGAQIFLPRARRKAMRNLVRIVWVLEIFVTAAWAANPRPQSTPQKGTSIVITFKDGHQQSFLMEDIARIEYTDAASSTPGPDHFLGKWEAGDGSGGVFFITFDTFGEAAKSIGASHGIWTVAGDEAPHQLGRRMARCDPQGRRQA